METNPCQPVNNRLQGISMSNPNFERAVYWQNRQRNELIAELATFYRDETEGQVLIYVKTVEHAYALRLLLDCRLHTPRKTYAAGNS